MSTVIQLLGWASLAINAVWAALNVRVMRDNQREQRQLVRNQATLNRFSRDLAARTEITMRPADITVEMHAEEAQS